MSKLLKLKDWVTVADAARHLESAFGEAVSESDVLRLALDGRLVLSVNFVNHSVGRPGVVSHYTEEKLIDVVNSGGLPNDLKWHHESPEGVKELRTMGFSHIPQAAETVGFTRLMSTRIDENRLLTLRDEAITLRGIYDLPMVGAERLDVEHKFQMLTGGPDVTLTNIEGAMVQAGDGEIFQLLQSWDDNKFYAGSTAQLEGIERQILSDKLSKTASKNLQDANAAARSKRKAELESALFSAQYYPAGGLPDDAVLVVRTAALSKFLDDVSGRTEQKSMGTKERNTLLCVIAALCRSAEIDYQKSSKNAGIIRQIAHEKLGVSIGDTTIENYLKLIPDALESRSK